MSEVRRRDFLQFSWLSTWGLFLGYYGFAVISEGISSPQLNKGGERTVFSTQAADYSFISGTHGIQWDRDTELIPAEPLDARLLPSQFDALVLEVSSPYLEQGKAIEIVELYRQRPFSKDLMTAAGNQMKDIIIADVPINYVLTEPPRYIINTIATFQGLELVRKLIRNEGVNISDSLRSATLAWRALTDFGSDLAYYLYYKDAIDDSIKEVAGNFEGALELLNPQIVTRTFRNAMTAAKMQGFEQLYRSQLGRRPHFVMIGGSKHHGLSGFLQLDKKTNAAYVKSVYVGPFRDLFVLRPELMYVSAQLIYNPDGSLKENFLQDLYLKEQFG